MTNHIVEDEATRTEIVYAMPYDEYKRRHQREATADQLEKFAVAEKKATP